MIHTLALHAHRTHPAAWLPPTRALFAPADAAPSVEAVPRAARAPRPATGSSSPAAPAASARPRIQQSPALAQRLRPPCVPVANSAQETPTPPANELNVVPAPTPHAGGGKEMHADHIQLRSCEWHCLIIPCDGVLGHDTGAGKSAGESDPTPGEWWDGPRNRCASETVSNGGVSLRDCPPLQNTLPIHAPS